MSNGGEAADLAPVRTERLLLRRLRADDLDAVHSFQSRADVARYLYRNAMTRDEAGAWLASSIASRFADEGTTLRLALTVPPDDRCIGYVHLHRANNPARQAETGYVIHPDHAGRGYATEAAREALALGFEHFGFHRIFARVDAQNAASIRICERLGMRREAHLVENDRRNGRWGSELVYAMLAREWNAAYPDPVFRPVHPEVNVHGGDEATNSGSSA